MLAWLRLYIRVPIVEILELEMPPNIDTLDRARKALLPGGSAGCKEAGLKKQLWNVVSQGWYIQPVPEHLLARQGLEQQDF